MILHYTSHRYSLSLTSTFLCVLRCGCCRLVASRPPRPVSKRMSLIGSSHECVSKYRISGSVYVGAEGHSINISPVINSLQQTKHACRCRLIIRPKRSPSQRCWKGWTQHAVCFLVVFHHHVRTQKHFAPVHELTSLPYQHQNNCRHAIFKLKGVPGADYSSAFTDADNEQSGAFKHASKPK